MSNDIEKALRAEFAGRADRATTAMRSPYPELDRRIVRRRRTRTTLTAAVAVAALGAGTGIALGTRDGGDRTGAAATGTVVGGCGATPLLRGTPPAWTAFSRAPKDLPYVVSAQGNAVGFVWADPLHAGSSGNTSNKILWVVRTKAPEAGLLTIDARPPRGSSAAPVHHQEPGAGGAGAYPSITDVSTPGCWHFTLTWSGGTAAVDLSYT